MWPKHLLAEARAAAALTDQNDRFVSSKVIQAMLDLLHRQIDRFRNVPRREFSRPSNVDELQMLAFVNPLLQFLGRDRFCHTRE